MKIKLNELLRREIISRSKSQSPERMLRSKKYSAKDFKHVNFLKLFEEDTFVWVAKIGKHAVVISFEGPFEELKWYVKSMRGPNRVKRLSQSIVAKALSNALDTNDIYIACSCEDFKYRFNYVASKANIKYGPQETRPPKKTNPNNDKGLVCKHILSVLVGKRWVPSAAKAWLDYMRNNVELTESYLWDMDIKRSKKVANSNKDNSSTEESNSMEDTTNDSNKLDRDIEGEE